SPWKPNVRNGSEAEIPRSCPAIPSTPESGLRGHNVKLPPRTTSGLMHCTILRTRSPIGAAEFGRLAGQRPFAFKIRSDFCVLPCVRQIGALADKAAGDKAGT